LLRNVGKKYTLELYGSLATIAQNTFGNYGYGVNYEIGYFESQAGKILDVRYNTWNDTYQSFKDLFYDNTTVLPSSWPYFRGNTIHTGLSSIQGPLTNKLLWKFSAGDKIQASPAIGPDGTIYVGSDDKWFYAVDGTTGNQKWKFKVNQPILSTPAVAPDGNVYIAGQESTLYALTSGGSLRWSYGTGGSLVGSIVIGSDGTIYFGSYDNALYAMIPSGTVKWKFLTTWYILSTPTIAPDGTIYIGSYDKYMYAVTPAGTLKWKTNIGANI